jgi:hypothetical protein
MRIPENIQVGPFEIKVEFAKELIINRGVYGEYHPKKHKILIDESNSKQQKWGTFIHELVEACNSIYGLKMGHDLIETLSVGLSQGLISLRGEED